MCTCTVRAVENVQVKYFGDFKKSFLRVMYTYLKVQEWIFLRIRLFVPSVVGKYHFCTAVL